LDFLFTVTLLNNTVTIPGKRPTYLTSSEVVDETQRYQLCHYDVVVAQLVALGFIKSV
jgi:hypothetical protein